MSHLGKSRSLQIRDGELSAICRRLCDFQKFGSVAERCPRERPSLRDLVLIVCCY